MQTPDRREILAEVETRIIREAAPAYERAMTRYVDHDGRLARDPEVHRWFYGIVREILPRLRGLVKTTRPGRPSRLLGIDSIGLAALTEAFELLDRDQPRDEVGFARTGLLPELVTLFAQELGVFRDRYLEYVGGLPIVGRYEPEHFNIGPTGRCNLRCPTCILWGALFRAAAGARGIGVEELLGHLREAEQVGLNSLSFCIGEPTLNLPVLEQVLARVQSSETLQARSFVTNGLFAKTRARALEVWRRILGALGEEKCNHCVFALSANPELQEQGVPSAQTVLGVETFLEVMPCPVVAVQLIRDEGYLLTQREIVVELEQRGLLRDPPPEGLGETFIEHVIVKDGRRVVFSVMAKMAAVNRPGSEETWDPWVFYLDPAALERRTFPGLFMPITGAQKRGSHERIALGPDGQLYVDYHFMVRGVRPLGTSLPEALESFGRDPLLTKLKEVGGVNALFDAYDAMPDSQKPFKDLRGRIERYSTVPQVAANVFFGDEDLALRLARHLVEAKPQGS